MTLGDRGAISITRDGTSNKLNAAYVDQIDDLRQMENDFDRALRSATQIKTWLATNHIKPRGELWL